MSNGGTVFVKKRIGQLPYKQDLKVFDIQDNNGTKNMTHSTMI